MGLVLLTVIIALGIAGLGTVIVWPLEPRMRSDAELSVDEARS